MDILFIICPPVWERLPLLGIAYLSEYLKLNGHVPYIYDLNILSNTLMPDKYKKDWTTNPSYSKNILFNEISVNHNDLIEDIKDIIRKKKIKYLGFPIFKSNRYFCLKLSRILKDLFPSLKTIFGGPEVFSIYLENTFNGLPGDFFVVGEGEIALNNILTGNRPAKISIFDQLENIDFFPGFEEFDLSMYSRKQNLPILFGRGCVNSCSFCSEKFLFRGYRSRPGKTIVDEIRYHISKNGIKWFTFYDSMLNADLAKFTNLINLLIESDVNISWDAQIAIRDDMDKNIFKMIKKSGCVNLFIGMESGSEKILKKMNKNHDIKDALSFLSNLKEADLNYELSFILDHPGETRKDFNETLDFIKLNRHLINKIAQVNSYKFYPGTINHNEKYSFPQDNYDKMSIFLKTLEYENIKYTKQYINNLI